MKQRYETPSAELVAIRLPDLLAGSGELTDGGANGPDTGYDWGDIVKP